MPRLTQSSLVAFYANLKEIVGFVSHKIGKILLSLVLEIFIGATPRWLDYSNRVLMALISFMVSALGLMAIFGSPPGGKGLLLVAISFLCAYFMRRVTLSIISLWLLFFRSLPKGRKIKQKNDQTVAIQILGIEDQDLEIEEEGKSAAHIEG